MIRIAVLCTLSLAACNAPVPDSADDAGDSTANTGGSGQRYDCDTGATVFAKTTRGTAQVALEDGTTLKLSRVRSTGSTVTYAADGWVWFVDGDSAVLTEQGGQKNCRVSAL